MVVIGGLGSIPGAVLGALYLEGLPALFGANPTIQFLTSGLGLIAFILYLPGGLAEVLHRLGDAITVGSDRPSSATRAMARPRRRRTPPRRAGPRAVGRTPGDPALVTGRVEP